MTHLTLKIVVIPLSDQLDDWLITTPQPALLPVLVCRDTGTAGRRPMPGQCNLSSVCRLCPIDLQTLSLWADCFTISGLNLNNGEIQQQESFTTIKGSQFWITGLTINYWDPGVTISAICSPCRPSDRFSLLIKLITRYSSHFLVFTKM